MQLTSALYRSSVLYFAAFVLLVLFGFWSTYYSNPLQLPNLLLHARSS